MKTDKLFTIIICTYNSEKRIGRTINHILAQNKFSELVDKFIIVNNNSSDNTQQVINSFGSVIKSIFEPKQGVSYARLAGAKEVKTPWLIYIDDDNFIQQNWLVEAVNFIDQNPKIGAFNGAIIPLIEDKLTNEERERLAVCYRILACSHIKQEDIGPLPGYIPICAGLVARTKPIKQFIKHGWTKRPGRVGNGLLSGEDVEIVLYIKSQGYEIGFCPSMVIKHLIGKHRLSWLYLLTLYRNDDIELELRSSKFGHFSSLYLISDSVVAIIKYIFKKMMPNVTRKEIMILEIKKEKAIAYLNNLFHGKRLPGTVKSLFGHYDFSGRQGF